MLINLRNALMSGKRPPYDAEVEFLQSDSLAFVNTGILPNNITKWECRASFSKYYTSGYFFAAYKGANYNDARIVLQTTDNRKAWSNCGSRANAGTTEISEISKNVFYDFKCERTQSAVISYKDGVRQSVVPFVAGDYNDQPIALFQRSGNNSVARDIGCRIACFKLWENGVLIRDYIPVRRGTVGYLYDRVSGALFGNAGTGDFVLGPDVVPVEYIESHRTEYIDTGYIPNQQTRWELDYQFSTIGLGLNGMFQEDPTIRFNSGQVANGLFNISYGANNDLNIACDTLRHLFVIDAPNLQWRLDSSSGAFSATVSTTLRNSLRIFCRNSKNGTAYNLHSGRCFASRMYQSDALSQKLLPVRVGTEGAMMDALTRRVYRNAGTGAFTYGNDLPYPIPAS